MLKYFTSHNTTLGSEQILRCLSIEHVSQHMPVFVRTIVGMSSYLCPRLIDTWNVRGISVCFLPHFRKAPTAVVADVCLPIRHHFSRCKAARYNARIICTNLKPSLFRQETPRNTGLNPFKQSSGLLRTLSKFDTWYSFQYRKAAQPRFSPVSRPFWFRVG